MSMAAPSAEAAFSDEQENLGNDFVTMMVCGQWFGVPVMEVQDILGPQRITHVPLAPPEVVGSLNLRGRIVTAVDMRIRLGLPPRPAEDSTMSVVVHHDGELYSLVVDQVGEVASLPKAAYEKTPATLQDVWKDVANGIYRLPDNLLVVLDVMRFLRIPQRGAA